jgi:hypothetical protein
MKIAASCIARAAVPFLALVSTLFPLEAWSAPGTFDLLSPGNGAWCTATCTFKWQSASSAATYDLYVDGAPKHAAVAATTYTLAADETMPAGWHTWSVVAKDSGGGTTSSASTFSVRVDASPPTAFTLLTPADSAFVPASPVTFTWSPSSDSDSGLDHYEVWVNGAAANPSVLPSATSAPAPLPTTAVFSDPINSGCANWTLGSFWYCSNVNGDPEIGWGSGCCDYNRSGHFDLKNPIDLSGVGQAVLSFSYQGLIGSSANYRARASDDNGATWADVLTLPQGDFQTGWNVVDANLPMAGTTLAKVGFNAYDNSWTNSWNVDDVTVTGIAAGAYAWYVVAQDVAGNRTTSATRQVRYDLPPVPFDLATPANGTWTANPQPTFSWNATTDAGSGLAKYQLWVDGNLAVDNISAAATSAAPASALADGSHTWWVAAVDAAGAVRESRQKFGVGIDTTPPQSFAISPASPWTPFGGGISCQSTFNVPTPSLPWNPSSDAGSGLDHYQLVIDGVLDRDGISPDSTSATPSTALAEGVHTYVVNAVDKVGNVREAINSCTVAIDFNPPSVFSLVSPVEYATYPSGWYIPQVSLTPTFTWTASTDAGLDHYELYVDEPPQGALSCVACSIPATSTSVALTNPLSAGTHKWAMRVVDAVGGFAWAMHEQSNFASFTAECDGPCAPEPAAEPRPELGPEPSPDAGVDAPLEVGHDVATGTSTSTATSTATTTGTSTSTATSTATDTSVGAEPRPDGSPTGDAFSLGPDALPAGPDGLRSDTIPNPDAILANVDAVAAHDSADGGATDAIVDLLPRVDGPASSGGSLDAAARDAVSSALDGAGRDGATTSENGSSGCGCAIGAAGSGTTWKAPAIVLGFLLLSLGAHPRRKVRRAPPSK